jgi:hypothetical protein
MKRDDNIPLKKADGAACRPYQNKLRVTDEIGSIVLV